MHELTDPDLAWLTDDGALTGYDEPGWPHATWILHAMYEYPGMPANLTHDDLSRLAREVEAVPSPFAEIDAATTATGIPLGYASRPGPGAERLRWADYLDLSVERPVPPCYRWFPGTTFPARILPPPEGSLDEASLTALLDVLGHETRCFVFYGSCLTGDYERPTVFDGRLAAVPDLVARFGATPSNLWPPDRSWFVWTDWDLMATKISGSAELMAALEATADLETCPLTG